VYSTRSAVYYPEKFQAYEPGRPGQYIQCAGFQSEVDVVKHNPQVHPPERWEAYMALVPCGSQACMTLRCCVKIKFFLFALKYHVYGSGDVAPFILNLVNTRK
jgi:hypothetical protein